MYYRYAQMDTNGQNVKHRRPTSQCQIQTPSYQSVQLFCAGIIVHQCLYSRELSPSFCMKDTLPSRLVCANLLIYCSAKVTTVPFFSLGQVYERLNKLLMCASHQSTIREIDRFGVDFDSRVKEWQASLLQRTALHMQVC